jgi:hypothetical protein
LRQVKNKKKGGKTMATKEEMKKLAIRAIEDDSFRADLRADPAKAAASMGITFTPEELAEMKEVRAKAEAAGLRESKVGMPALFI